MKLWSVVLVALMAVVHVDAEAKRMGGGQSVGQQSSNVTQRQATLPAASPGAASKQRSRSQAGQANAAPPLCAQEPPGAGHAGRLGRWFGLGLVGQLAWAWAKGLPVF